MSASGASVGMTMRMTGIHAEVNVGGCRRHVWEQLSKKSNPLPTHVSIRMLSCTA